MQKKLLIRINLILGAISLALAGCHSTKKTVRNDDMIRLMYGVPVEQVQPADTLETPDLPPESSDPSGREIIVTKYGIPSSF